MTQNKFKGRLYLGISLAILLVLMMGSLFYYSNVQERESENWINHTILVKAKLQDINVDLKDNAAAIRAKRRYRSLDSLMPGLDRTTVVMSLSQLRELIKDNPVQYANGVQLQDDINRLFALWRSINPNETITDDKKEESYFIAEVHLMSIVKADIDKMDAYENMLLSQRRAANEHSMDFNNMSTVIGTLLILLVVIALAVNVRTEFRKRNIAELNLNDKIVEQRKLNDQIALNNEVLYAAQVLMEKCQLAKDVPSFLNTILDGILEFTGITTGVIYIANNEEHTGELLPFSFRGIAPEFVRNSTTDVLLNNQMKNAEAIHYIENVPADYWHVSSATGSKVPGELVFINIRFKQELIGVMELAAFQPLSLKQKEYLKMLPGGIAIRLAALQLTESRNMLLNELQVKQEILLNQQEELRQSNEELIHQTKVLQASEEELRVQEEELKQINTELEEKHDALELAHQVMDVKANELEQSTKYKSEFLANMSHELRTPLNSILILANLLGDNKSKNLSDKQVEYAKIIANSGSDLLKLINDILDLSKIEAGKVELSFESVSIASIVSHMREMFQVITDQKKIHFDIKVNVPAEQTINTDLQRLEQILKNLLSNAIKFTGEGGAVSLEIYRNAANIIGFKVNDTGIGIDASKLDLIFEAFRQEDGSTNRRYGGTGLGLSISKELAKMLKGQLHVESQLGIGSMFELRLPEMMGNELVAEPKAAVVNNSHPVKQSADIGIDKTILIIEDDANFANILKNFAEDRSYKTLMAANGKLGLQMAKDYKPDAIILDLQMPVMDGWEVLKALKANPELTGIPVHIISAMDEDKAPTSGAVEYVRKPVTIDELEKTFMQIGAYLSAVKHRLMIWSSSATDDNTLLKLISNLPAGVTYDFVTDITEVIELGNKHHYDCILADVSNAHEDYFRYLQEIRENNLFSGTSLILLIDQEISSNDEMRLKKMSEAIVMKSKEAHTRLKDELELFMFRVKDHQPDVSAGQNQYIDNNSLEGRKVLVADDDMRNVFALVGLLENQKMEVVTASNGIEALQSLEENPEIDIVLMDIMMPEMDGYEAMRKVRSQPRYRDLPIIALTAKAMSNDRELCIEAGASDYMSKPVNAEKLLSLIRIWLS